MKSHSLPVRKEFDLTKMIYVASPYTFKHPEQATQQMVQARRYLEVTEAIGKLQDEYDFAFIGPITQSHHTVKAMSNKDTTFRNWAKRDFTYISRCDEVWVIKMEGWSESVGVLSEIDFATKHGIPIKYLSPDTLTFEDNK